MEKFKQILLILTAVVWLFIGVFLIYSLISAKVRGEGFACYLLRKYCPRQQVWERMNWERIRRRLTPEVRECIRNKLGKEKTEELLRRIREGKKLSRQELKKIRECFKED